MCHASTSKNPLLTKFKFPLFDESLKRLEEMSASAIQNQYRLHLSRKKTIDNDLFY